MFGRLLVASSLLSSICAWEMCMVAGSQTSVAGAAITPQGNSSGPTNLPSTTNCSVIPSSPVSMVHIIGQLHLKVQGIASRISMIALQTCLLEYIQPAHVSLSRLCEHTSHTFQVFNSAITYRPSSFELMWNRCLLCCKRQGLLDMHMFCWADS